MSTLAATFETPALPPEEFWDRYNQRFEFPLSTVLAVLIHAIVAALVVFALFQLMKSSPSQSGVPVQLIDLAGLDDDGDGSPGSGNMIDAPIRKNSGNALEGARPVPPSSDIPKVEADIRTAIGDLDLSVPISPENAERYNDLDRTLREKLLPKAVPPPGAGGGEGRGNANQKGPG